VLVGIVGSVAYVTARREGGRLLAGGGGWGSNPICKDEVYQVVMVGF